MFYSHPFQHYPQQTSNVSGPFMAPFLPPLLYSLAGHPMFSQPGFSSNAPFNSRGKYLSPTSIDSCVLNSSADPSSSSAPGRSNDEGSVFNKSASDPYNYPMTQMRVLLTFSIVQLILNDFIAPNFPICIKVCVLSILTTVVSLFESQPQQARLPTSSLGAHLPQKRHQDRNPPLKNQHPAQ
jgi:hypothetical protein